MKRRKKEGNQEGGVQKRIQTYSRLSGINRLDSPALVMFKVINKLTYVIVFVRKYSFISKCFASIKYLLLP